MREADRRNEVFFNQTLARDEITQLLAPKVLTAAVRHTVKGKQTKVQLNRDAELNQKRGLSADTITDNLLIKGNNLLALHSLKSQFAGKVKLIYIDPPYNTGGDSFKYNDNFNHSTWLTFMKNRLEVARELLHDDGVIFVQCDDNEQSYLKVLMDEVFGREVASNTLCVKTSDLSGPKMAHKTRKIPKIKEFILMYAKGSSFTLDPQYVAASWDDACGGYDKFLIKNGSDDCGDWTHVSLKQAIKNHGVDENDHEAVAQFKINNADKIFQTALNRSKKEAFAKVVGQKFQMVDGTLVFSKNEVIFASKKIREINGIMQPANIVGDIWMDMSLNGMTAEGGVDFKNGKKPERLLQRIISLVTQANDIVLDYHLGSGTTAAVAHKMDRQYIGVEQMDYMETIAVQRVKKVIDGYQGGISKSVGWKSGGEFVTLELKQHNQQFVDAIQAATTARMLSTIWQKMETEAFLDYNLDIEKQKEYADDFKALSLEQQKKFLLEILDKNQMYVNLSSLKDADRHCNAEEKRITADFYGLKKMT